MIPRILESRLHAVAGSMPAVAVTGPRQSGKTTLSRAAFPGHSYVSLEPLDTREFAEQDPRGFLAQHGDGVILDEVQRVPGLFSYLQEEIDRDPSPGRFILTGSQHFGLSEAISQSLAGRVGLLHLLPMSLDELAGFPSHPQDLWTAMWTGGYPRIYDRDLNPNQWLADYVATYVQRDVRQIQRVTDFTSFGRFLRLAAGRTGQEENLASLGSDAGVTHPTVRSWLSVLEASFVVFRVPRWHRNVRKRVVKAPKMHFVDTGLACHLLGIRGPEQLRSHPLRGPLFETWVASEVLKARLHRGLPAELYHLREARGVELDLLVEGTEGLIALDAKSGATIASDFFRHLRTFSDELDDCDPPVGRRLRLIYGGIEAQERHGVDVLPWSGLQDVDWT